MELYVHIPYCRQKCRYCDFASFAGSEGTQSMYVNDVLMEAALLASCHPQEQISTAYLGGGTPSVLPPALLKKLLHGIFAVFPLKPDTEFTTEANPGTLTEEWLQTAVQCRVNRLSLGMQAVQPELLHTLGRIHDFQQVQQSVLLAQKAGITNISIDLMFGLPGQTIAMWRESLEAVLSLGVRHLSCYGLIPEEGTPLFHDLQSGRLSLPNEEDERRMYDMALDLLAKAGFRQYEISNFAIPGYECRHNIGYWRQEAYVGLGVSAASCWVTATERLRTANPRTIPAYHQMIAHRDGSMREQTVLTDADSRFETLMLGLRMNEGVSEAAFAAMHHATMESIYGDKLRNFEHQGLLHHENGRWALTRRGMDVQNAILVELMDS